ncbi:MAG TPA: Gfo/Idh/MocA family oxidoreductase [Conexibacter sp.]|jgi:predicted dehydrogenase|nr:Gfo/Idh/MocA family oxidoreductase [Conexibacter sp.]
MATERVRVGVIGGGLIAQAAHLPNLRRLDTHFELVALADPSAKVREQVGRRFNLPATYETWEALVDAGGIDAVVICTPHSAHAGPILAALDAGLDVLVEKPLCVTLEDAERIVEAEQRTGRIVQVAYMKRYDPAVERMMTELPREPGKLRYVSVVTYDPNMVREPFFLPSDLVRGDDIPAATLERMRRSEREQLAAETGTDDPVAWQAYNFTFLSALSHDLNLIHGVLEQIGESLPAEVIASGRWADGWAGSGTLQLASGVQGSLTWLWLDGLQEYRDRFAVYLADAVHTLSFPAPYLGWPTTYERRHGDALSQASQRATAAIEPYVAELLHFHACVTQRTPCRTAAAQARLDMQVLKQMFLAAQAGVAGR